MLYIHSFEMFSFKLNKFIQFLENSKVGLAFSSIFLMCFGS
jgi:hypothetical protein